MRCVNLAFLVLVALGCGDTHGMAPGGTMKDSGLAQDPGGHPSAPDDGAVTNPRDASRPGTEPDAGSTAGATGGAAGANGSAPPTKPKPSLCAAVQVAVETVIPDVLIVLDRSGSMLEGGRWEPSVAAVRELTMERQAQARFGLALFPDAAASGVGVNDCVFAPDPEACLNEQVCAPGAVVVPPALDNAAPIAAALDAQQPAGGTPTGETLQALVDTFAGPSPQLPDAISSKAVLLITDGQPTCPAGMAQEATQPDIDLTMDAIEALAARGVMTYVLGYDTTGPGNEMIAAVLDGFAQAGGTGDTAHRSVSDQASLLAELRATVGMPSCTFELERIPEHAALVTVHLDGVELSADDPDGWTLVDDRTVQLTGAACAKLAQNGAHSIRIDVHCE